MGSSPDVLHARLHLAGQSYVKWDREARDLMKALVGSARVGLVDGQHLVRAGELIDLIAEELAMLDAAILETGSSEIAGQAGALRERLSTLQLDIREAAHELHGITR